MPSFIASLTDTGAAVWNGGINKGVGTYYFDMQTAANGSVPAAAQAIVVHVGANWAAASQSNYILVRKRGVAQNAIVVRSSAANINMDRQGIVELDVNGDVEVVVAGATANACEFRLIGWFM